MYQPMNAKFTVMAIAFIAFLDPTRLFSQTDKSSIDAPPVAVRRWPEEGFTIETMGNLHVGIGLTAADSGRLPRPVDMQVEDLQPAGGAMLRWSVETSRSVTQPVTQSAALGENRGGIFHVDYDVKVSRDAWNTAGVTQVTAADLVIVNLNAASSEGVDGWIKHLERETNSGSSQIEASRLVVIATADIFNEMRLKKIHGQLRPQTMIVSAGIGKIGAETVEVISHNTVALSAAEKNDQDEKKRSVTQFVSLGDQPWKMSDELARLYAKKEAACQSSREMFAKLSATQMNFKPGDGTHTARWNAEHMMGRELLFFSQIYHAVDPRITVIDLNPRQMPDAYTFAHPDWSGAEEAAQMMRVEAFTRRFAYLLEGMNLDEKTKGSKFWSPRGLLEQMERHYKQHSANVIKKMDLEGWPNDEQ